VLKTTPDPQTGQNPSHSLLWLSRVYSHGRFSWVHLIWATRRFYRNYSWSPSS